MIQKKYLILITVPLAIVAIILMLLPKPEKRGDTNEIIETDSVTGFEGTTEEDWTLPIEWTSSGVNVKIFSGKITRQSGTRK